jgi:hypothetical protein
MARPTRILVHDGEEWVAMLTGGSTITGDYRIGVLFLAKKTAREAVGQLRGIPPDRFDQTTVDELRAALIAALSDDDE